MRLSLISGRTPYCRSAWDPRAWPTMAWRPTSASRARSAERLYERSRELRVEGTDAPFASRAARGVGRTPKRAAKAGADGGWGWRAMGAAPSPEESCSSRASVVGRELRKTVAIYSGQRELQPWSRTLISDSFPGQMHLIQYICYRTCSN